MTRPRALPFTIRRGDDVIGAEGIASTVETIHGLLLLDGDSLQIQWRLHRATDLVGKEIRTDQQVEPVRTATIPLADVSGGAVRRPWWGFGRVVRLVLTAADLRALEQIAGADGLALGHPAQLVLRVRPEDRAAANEFVADLDLALADRAMRVAAGPGGPERLGSGAEAPSPPAPEVRSD